MTDTTTQASPSPTDQGAQPAVDTSQTDENLDHTQGDGEHGEGEEGQPLEETQEVEIGGKKYVLPKEVARAAMREADYTRSKQALADLRREFEAERTSHGERVRSDAQLIRDNREMVAIEWQIQTLQGMDPAEFRNLPQEQQNQIHYRLRQLDNELGSKRNAYAQQMDARKSESERASATRKDQAQAEIARAVEGWSPQLQDTLKAVALKDLGMSEQDFSFALENPKAMRLIHLANLGFQSVTKAKAAAAQTTTLPAPTRTVSGGGSSASNGLSDRMSSEQWQKARNAQLRKR